VVDVPVACTLSSSDATERLAEWRLLLSSGVDRTEVGETVARFRLVGDDDALVAVVDLAEREKACCSFFEFAIELDGARRWLRVGVPPDSPEAAAVLRELASLGGEPAG
jgi:hypothetical protein